MVRFFLNFVLWVMPPSRLFWLRRVLLRISSVELGSNVKFCGQGWVLGRGALAIGDDTWLSPGVRVYTHQDVEVRIGRACDIGHEVSFVTGSHKIGTQFRRAGTNTAAAINVEDGCWLGARVLVLGGVTIGSGSIVAAGSVVTRNIPSNVLAAGVPATVKRNLAGDY